MSFQLDRMRAMGRPVVRVVVARVQGSVPREVGASMLVLEDDVVGTIGGGALEHEAIGRARNILKNKGPDLLNKVPLGPGLGQCCGGAVTLLSELWDEKRLSSVTDMAVRPTPGMSPEMPFSVNRILAAARNASRPPVACLCDGWMIEPVLRPDREVWVWGAGHVGRALVNVLDPLPEFQLRWADTNLERFPKDLPSRIETLTAAAPAELATLAGSQAEHFVMTYSHALDLEICHRILGRSFGFLGLIGSATKRTRFRKRLADLGHSPPQIDRLICPIGDPGLGKQPQAIALGVATKLLRDRKQGAGTMEHRA